MVRHFSKPPETRLNGIQPGIFLLLQTSTPFYCRSLHFLISINANHLKGHYFQCIKPTYMSYPISVSNVYSCSSSFYLPIVNTTRPHPHYFYGVDWQLTRTLSSSSKDSLARLPDHYFSSLKTWCYEQDRLDAFPARNAGEYCSVLWGDRCLVLPNGTFPATATVVYIPFRYAVNASLLFISPVALVRSG